MKLATTLEPKDARLLRKLHAELGKLLAVLPGDVGAGRRSAEPTKPKRVGKMPTSNLGPLSEFVVADGTTFNDHTVVADGTL